MVFYYELGENHERIKMHWQSQGSSLRSRKPGEIQPYHGTGNRSEIHLLQLRPSRRLWKESMQSHASWLMWRVMCLVHVNCFRHLGVLECVDRGMLNEPQPDWQCNLLPAFCLKSIMTWRYSLRGGWLWKRQHAKGITKNISVRLPGQERLKKSVSWFGNRVIFARNAGVWQTAGNISAIRSRSSSNRPLHHFDYEYCQRSIWLGLWRK